MLQAKRGLVVSVVVVALVSGLASLQSAASGANHTSNHHREQEEETNLKVNYARHSQRSAPDKTIQDSTSSDQLIALKPGQNYLSPHQTEIAVKFLFEQQDNSQQERQTLAEYSYASLMAKLVCAAYNDYFLHRYDNFKDLRDSNSASVNQETCIGQLRELNERADAADLLGSQSADIEFLRLMDTFGKQSAGTFAANTFWTGSYDACVRLSISSIRDKQPARIRNRYCVASLKLDEWSPLSEGELEKMMAFKMALCLPKSCDAQHYKNKYQLIERLIEFNMPRWNRYGAKLAKIHCLPDEESPLRDWWRSRPTLIVVCCTASWLLLLVFATYKYESRRQQQQQQQKQPKAGEASGESDKVLKLYKSLSITSNLRSLFQVVDKSKATNTTPEESTVERKQTEVVNLDMVEGIKVLAACYIITGHVIMIAATLIRDGQELGTTTSFAWRMANLMPAFAVNAFFVITGLLTSYLIFKQNQPSNSIITNPIKWILLMLYRYLRIMPMYALVTLFCKHVARYLGDGPLWDYGTSSLAARRTCEQEPWAWTLLFGANFKSPIKHCIPSAWYLANDFQFLIVTPFFLTALHLRPKLGTRLLVVATIAGYVAGFWNILAQDAHDLRPVVMFWPHGFTTYVNYLHVSYTQPQYRVPAYLIGLLFGYTLYQHERKRQDHSSSQDKEPLGGEEQLEWPQWMRRSGSVILFGLVVICTLSPYVAPFLDFGKSFAHALTAFIMPTYHLLYSLSVGVYILLATTGHGNKLVNRLLALSFWKPLARLSLCVVLINVEVVSYIIQTQRDFHVLTNQYHTCLNILSILCTYLVATVVCVLFEAPVRSILNQLLALAMSRASDSEKKTRKKTA